MLEVHVDTCHLEVSLTASHYLYKQLHASAPKRNPTWPGALDLSSPHLNLQPLALTQHQGLLRACSSFLEGLAQQDS